MKKSEPDFQSTPSEESASKKVTTGDTISIPVIQETAKIGKHLVESGTVRIDKKVHEKEVVVEVPVEHDEMEVKRIPINQYIKTPPPAMRYEGDTMVIPVLKEVVFTEKRLMLVEEVRVTKRKNKETVQEKVNLRKEEVTVKQVRPTSDKETRDTPQ